MPHNIEVDDEVFGLLKQNAEPFVDTPNSTLRRLLRMDDDGHRPAATAAATAAMKANGRTAAPMSDGSSPRRSKSAKKAQVATKSPRAKRGTLLPESEYELPILRYLSQHDRAPSREVIEAIGEDLDALLTEEDKKPLASGDIRWKNRAAFVRLRLVERGELNGHAPRGTWQITDKGRDRINSAT